MVFYSLSDLILFPMYAVLFSLILYSWAKARKLDPIVKSTLFTAFWFRVFFCLSFFLVIQFYYKGGDTFSYFICVQDLHRMSWALKSDFLLDPLQTVKPGSVLFYEFSYDLGYSMDNLSNATVVKVAYYISSVFGNSYLTVAFFFSMFAYLGSWQLYMLFLKYYPTLRKELAMATLFLPSVCFWSSGLLKDSLTLGSVGFVIWSFHNLLVTRKKILISIILLGLNAYLLVIIKVYIMFALLPGLLVWAFIKWNFKGLNKQFKRVITFLFLIVAGGLGYVMLQYLGSTEYAREISTENLTEKIEQMRDIYARNEVQMGDSYFDLGTKNIALAFPLGIVATLFRPFLWEIRSFTMFFSGIEAFAFLILTLYLFTKLGIVKAFKAIFTNSDTLFFFIFCIIFAGAVGTSTPNFGSLVRYKIPCLPFYMMMLLITIHNAKLPYPKWLNRLLGKNTSKPVTRQRMAQPRHV